MDLFICCACDLPDSRRFYVLSGFTHALRVSANAPRVVCSSLRPFIKSNVSLIDILVYFAVPIRHPRYGIFRLTDPGGLQVILDCKAKEAFHPHPAVPIYTVSRVLTPHPADARSDLRVYRTVTTVMFK